MIIGLCIFCLVLFFYLHIQFHLKTGEDLEMYEIDQPSKDRLEEICDLRQPVLFDFECEKIIKNILSYFSIFQPKYNSVILDGKRCLKVTNYLTKTDNLFSNRFSAFWYYISKNNMNNDSIYCIREYANSSNIYDDYGEPKRYNKNYEVDNDIDLDDVDTNKDLFIVDQTKYFKLTENIYCKVSKVNDTGDEKKSYEMEHITIEIYSYKLGLNDIVKYIDNIDNDYKNSLKKARNNKKYIYTLIAANDNTNSNSYEREVLSKWEECEFISTRTFKNLFFENKKLGSFC